MSKPFHLVLRIIGVGVAAVGGMLSYNLFVAPLDRIGGPAMDSVAIFLGPALLAVGLLLLWGFRPTAPSDDEAMPAGRLNQLQRIGVLLIVIPPLLFLLGLLQQGLIYGGFLLVLSLIVFGLPGMVLLAMGKGRSRRDETV